MAAHGVGVGVLAGYAVLLGDVLGRHAHVVVVEDVPQAVVDHVVVDICFGHPHPVTVAALIQQERRPVHILDAASHDHVGVAKCYLLRRRDYGLKPRAAHPVQGHAWDLHGEAALYTDLATRVHALAHGEDVTDYNLVDLVALDPGAREDLFADRGPEFRSRRVLERTAESPYTRPEGCRDDYLADAVTEAHLFSFRLFHIRGYIKRQGPDLKARPPNTHSQCFTLRLLVGPALRLVQVALVVGEHGVEEVRVGVHRLLSQRPGGLPLLALLLDQVFRQGPVALGLGPQVVDNAVEEVLRQLGVELLGRDGTVRDGLVGFFQSIGEFLRRFVHLLLLLLVHDLTSSYSIYIRTKSYPISGHRNIIETKKERSGPAGPPQCFDSVGYALPGGLPRSLRSLLVVGEGRVSEVHVGVDGLLDERLVGVALVLGTLEELAHNVAVALGLVAKLLDGAVHHALREPDVALLETHRVIHNRLVGIPRTLSDPLNTPVGLLRSGHLYLLSRVLRELLATLFLVLQRPSRVQPEEVVHGVLVLLERLGPEVEVCPARVRDGVHPARRPTPRSLPTGLNDALFLHLPERPVQRSRIHRLEPEGRSPLHELVPVRVPLP